ncbi:endonuclease/exonuclease/phosphatase family protein [Acidithiobacillus ferrianus]|uniref:Endonuclease n=2 Tax=Acidithiobacillus ferrianus TaxID=2678518 RepID=A0A845UKM0_9PROT|nr:endonuclease/exonuclease/phosphatase family protein [Acidithiobacillus ferrianus]NDU42198.1 endonuclease [Acidithiobacillus ferrianus]
MTDTPEITVMSFNIQVGIGSSRARHMVLHGWKYVMPHGQSLRNLERIADILREADIVGLNEVDAGSFRSQYVNQAGFLAERAHFAHWEQQRTRDFGDFAQHSNSILSHWPIAQTNRHALPSFMKGRGMLETHLDVHGRPLTVIITHLGLSRHARFSQIRDLAQRLRGRPHLILMGDFNCTARSPEMRLLLTESGLRPPPWSPPTFPSWSPRFSFDHILCSPDLELTAIETIGEPLSDHLALKAKLRWGAAIMAHATPP